MIETICVLSKPKFCTLLLKKSSLKNYVVISICNTLKDNVMNLFNNKYAECIDYISLSFHDVTPNELEVIKDLKLNLFTKSQAIEIVKFLIKHKNRTQKYNLIVHCDGGISRSGAVGLFACRFLKLDEKLFRIKNPYIHPNQYIFHLLKEVSGMKKTVQNEYNELFKNV